MNRSFNLILEEPRPEDLEVDDGCKIMDGSEHGSRADRQNRLGTAAAVESATYTDTEMAKGQNGERWEISFQYVVYI